MAIVFGVSLLILSMGIIMGYPLVHYLKRDAAYEATEGQPQNIRLGVWYR